MNLHLAHRAALSLRLSPLLHLRSSTGGLSLSLSALAFGARGPAGPQASLAWSDIVDKPPITDRQEFLNSSLINITHNMQKYVGFIVLDTGGTRWFPKNFSYPSLNSIAIEFSFPFSGTVFLS